MNVPSLSPTKSDTQIWAALEMIFTQDVFFKSMNPSDLGDEKISTESSNACNPWISPCVSGPLVYRWPRPSYFSDQASAVDFVLFWEEGQNGACMNKNHQKKIWKHEFGILSEFIQHDVLVPSTT